MRLFVAVDVPREVEDVLAGLQKQLNAAKLTLTNGFHLTLKFLGEVSPLKAEQVKARLKLVRISPFTAVLGGVGVFPSERFARVVWVGVDPSDAFCELQKKVDDALESLFDREKDFQPHLTLARVKLVEDKNAFSECLKGLTVKHVSFEVAEFKLIESKLSRSGPEYRDVAVYRLKE